MLGKKKESIILILSISDDGCISDKFEIVDLDRPYKHSCLLSSLRHHRRAQVPGQGQLTKYFLDKHPRFFGQLPRFNGQLQ